MARIFIIEDEENIAELIKFHLKNEGHTCLIFDDGYEGQKACIQDTPDLIILDWMLPSLNGYTVCKNLHDNIHTQHIPILMLTALGEEDHKISGLHAGADDYMVKPFSPLEFIARIQALLRRTKPQLTQHNLKFENLELKTDEVTLLCNKTTLEISKIEFELIKFFMQNPKTILSRYQIIDNVWGYDININDRTVDVHIYRLRKKIQKNHANCDIVSKRGLGYMLIPK